MPASYTSARFVGREVAFARLAAVLDDAAGGRARTLILGGTAGVGVSRFLDEGLARVAGLSEPWTILRAGAWPSAADDPYGPVVRAIGPALRALDDADLADDPRARPSPTSCACCRTWPCGSASPSIAIASAPERRQARTLEAILGMLGRLGERQPGRARPGGPPSRPTPRPGRSSDSCRGSRATSAWPSSPRTSPTSCRATIRGPATWPPSPPAPRPLGSPRPRRRSIATTWRP